MTQSSASQHIHRRNSIDRKQRHKIEEKKQTHGQRSSGYEDDYNEEQTMQPIPPDSIIACCLAATNKTK